MRLWQILVGSAILVVTCYGEGIAIVGPQVIQPNRAFTVAISNSLPKHDVRLCVSLTSGDTDIIANRKHITETVRRKSMKLFTFKIGAIPNGDYTLNVDNVGGSVAVSKSVNLQYVSRTMSIFVQTDKPVYKPGDMLRYRIVIIDIDTKPVMSLKSLAVVIRDSDQQLIKQWNKPVLYNGIFESAMVLPSSPNLGNWSINVTADDGLIAHKKQQAFLVKEYVLPTFIVTAVPTELLLIENKKISLTIKAFYTVGDPVKGNATVNLIFQDDLMKKNQSISKNLEGSTEVEFNLDEEIQLENDESTFETVMVNLTVTEAFTNRVVHRSFDIPVYRYPFEIESHTYLDEENPNTTRVEIAVKEHDGRPVCCHSVQLMISSHSDAKKYRGIQTVQNGFLDEVGVASFELPISNISAVELKANIGPAKNITLDLSELDDHHEDVEEVITVVPNSIYKPCINKDYSFVVKSSYKKTHFWYVVINQGNIVAHGFMPGSRPKTILKLKITPQMAPKSNIVVFTTVRNALRYSNYEINLETFRNNFRFSTDTDEYSPQQDIKIVTNAAKDSYVAYHAIDVSALHVGHERFNGFGFTKQDVLNEMDQYMHSSHGISSLGAIGFFVESTANVAGAKSHIARFGYRRSVRKAILLRTDFPEVFLWHNISMRGKPSQTTIRAAPDSITSWQLTGFALSPTAGLGIMDEKVEFVVKKPFYIVANLPYSIKRNETSRIQVTVFNFLGSALTTDVWLYNKNDEIEFIDRSSSDTKKRKKTIVVPAHNGEQTSFLIKAKKLGNIVIKIEAENMLASDGLERSLLVTPESHHHVLNHPVFIEHDNRKVMNHKIKVDVPHNPDEGSVNITICATGEVLSPVVENLQSLFEKPTGCGEQNMLKFVPNVVILDYLEESGTINPELRTKAINFLEEGYANQLKYKLKNGSFSIFQHKRGGTFLTAFVAKSFKIADKHIQVDETIVKEAFDWLASIQDSDGLFPEVGDVYNKIMQGGLSDKKKSLSAFVAIAFLENTDIAQKYSSVINKTMNYLAVNLDNMDQYELALTTYAFALSNHAMKNDTLRKLLEFSIFDSVNSTRYWDFGTLSVETSSYALLSYLKLGYELDAGSIARWLISQRKSRGEYHGAQATFVGLKALAKFASIINRNRNEYTITVRQKHTEKNWQIAFGITDQEGLICHELPSDGRVFDVEVAGLGYGFFQVTAMYNYNINTQDRKTTFNVTVEQLPESTKHKQYMKVCTSFVQPEAYNTSNMALVEVFFPSGYEADEGSLEDLWSYEVEGKIQNFERRFAGSSIVVYYNTVDARLKCFTISASRVHLVARQLPSYVIVYDYDNQDYFGIQEYQGTILQPCDICDPIDCKAMNC